MGLNMYLLGVKEECDLQDYNTDKRNTQIEIGHWRKANQIHNWFVKNVQNGVDNSATYYVSRENLKTLKNICEEVLLEPNKAEKLLPTLNGFYFGRTEYDEKYFHDIQETIEICKNALEKDFDYFEYQSSW